MREIYIESEAEARYKKNRKMLKVFDFEQNKADSEIFKLSVPKDK